MIGQKAEYAARELPGPREWKISYKKVGWYAEAASLGSPSGIGEAAHVNSKFKLNGRTDPCPKEWYAFKKRYENPGFPRV